MMRRLWFAAAVILLMAISSAGAEPQPYKNFKVTVFVTVDDVVRMDRDPGWMESGWQTISSRLHVDKVFIENYRDGTIADDSAISRVKTFFQSHGVEVSGGMALTAPGNQAAFSTLDYGNPQDRALVERVAAQAARHFDEFILDDLYFFNTKSDFDIAAKGNRTWEQYRLQTMDEVSRDVILKSAKAVNPKVHVIIKFPNFYPYFQGMGFDLEQQPQIFPEIWTGDETRDPVVTDQQLQQYESYEIFRYFQNIAPGRNGGGWVDPYAMGSLDRYAEQLWDTILAKAPAINLFEYADLLSLAEPGARTAWETLPTSFDFSEMVRECCGIPGSPGSNDARMADVNAYALRRVDQVAGALGAPVGLASYRPHHSSGEDFLAEVLGMAGIPIELYPEWPKAKTVLLTEAAKIDPDIVSKIEQHVRAGDNVVITSGLLNALQDQGMNQITQMRVTGHVLAATSYVAGSGFGGGAELGTTSPILLPEIHIYTNDDWAVVRGLANGRGVPLLVADHYGEGMLYVLAVPESMNDLYRLPTAALDAIRRYLGVGLPVSLEGPAKVSLFEYDNGTFVVESYLDHPVSVRVTAGLGHIENVVTGVTLGGEPLAAAGGAGSEGTQAARLYGYELQIEPHSFVAFRERP
jgi:hypothetical protein